MLNYLIARGNAGVSKAKQVMKLHMSSAFLVLKLVLNPSLQSTLQPPPNIT